uniref:C2 domain-containing protein n=1 Tax=Cryptomonas curvata TaxID=233186 RepID=A0A7S0QQF9_9CRYP
MDGRSGLFQRLGETEWIKNNANPEFTKELELNYVFEKKQHLRITVLDVDNADQVPKEYTPNMAEGDLLGRMELTVAEIMGGKDWTVTRKLTAQVLNKDYGTVTIMGLKLEDSVRSDDLLVFQLNGIELAAKDHNVFTKASSDSFFTLSRVLPDRKELCTSEVHNQELNPKWKEQRVNFSELCGGDLRRDVRIDVSDKDSMTQADPIGLAVFPVERLLTKDLITLIDYKVPPRDIKAGFVQTRESAVYRTPTFMDYMADGLDVELVFAIDFTKSNGDPADPSSLHSRVGSAAGLTIEEAIPGLKVVRGPNWKWDDQDGGFGCVGEVVGPVGDNWVSVQWLDSRFSNSYRCGAEGEFDLSPHNTNRYQKAMMGVASTLMDFSKEKIIHAYGFGGKVDEGKTSFSFPLSRDVTVTGVKGLLDAYEQAMTNISFGESGTMMAEIVNRVVGLAKETVQNHPQKYYVLVILSDGDVDDIQDTIDAIVAASDLPISIITVGLTAPGHSEETYANWRVIDDGTMSIKDRSGKVLDRDTVNFIEIDEVNKKSDELTEIILHEFKQQLVQHFTLKNIRPKIWENDPVHNYRILQNIHPAEA